VSTAGQKKGIFGRVRAKAGQERGVAKALFPAFRCGGCQRDRSMLRAFGRGNGRAVVGLVAALPISRRDFDHDFVILTP
jgi:hypothetical protein